ncbi:hypothetical protein HSB1_18570 [Halogranum salarium B-1]|uniref:Uncharacterized protein n=1 Tax=Halogranum salarium B-1 TaxID=1210908 RepID=J3JFZ9_9EURY|nr:hypothetical protein HSB1_18570 [Halogranum salarium B-1]
MRAVKAFSTDVDGFCSIIRPLTVMNINTIANAGRIAYDNPTHDSLTVALIEVSE